MKDPISFSDKLFLWLTDRLDSSQSNELDHTVETDPDLKHLVEELQDTGTVRELIEEMDSFDVDRAWSAVSEKVAMATPLRTTTVRHFLRRFLIPSAVAAILIGALFLITMPRGNKTDVHLDEEIITAIAECDSHGMSGAVIEPDYVAAAPTKTVRKRHIENVTETQTDEKVVSEMLAAKRVTTLYNKEFWLTLPDGTIVHLARNTRIIYPERFTDKQRDVYMEGEAYFIVAKDASRKFVVHTKTASTIAYGTEFNVNATDYCEVILVNGEVGVRTNDGTERLLSPGEQAMVADGTITVSEADIEPIKAWNTGHIEFEDWTLSRVTDILAKWHGMKAEISDAEIADVKLSGNLDRYDQLQPTLESLSELLGIRFSSENDTITVSRQ